MLAVSLAFAGGTAGAAPSYQRYLDLPLTNRDASVSPGGVNPALPTDPKALRRALDSARADGVEPKRYAALLYQYWLADTTQAAGIDLAAWNPRAGVLPNRENLVRSYTFYEQLQLHHRELQWAGMGGQVGADFGGGLLDFDLATTVYEMGHLQPIANAIVTQTNKDLGPVFVDTLPDGVRALAQVGAVISAADLKYVQGMILVMQKNIFSDLMPMHRAYVQAGLPALTEMHQAGLFNDEILDAWRNIASKDPARVAAGNARLLMREQGEVIKDQWDLTRNYRGEHGNGPVGEALTYASTVAGSPSVAGVIPMRSYRPIEVSGTLADGRTATLTLPLPSWNWSDFDDRWEYINDQLLPKYRDLVDNHWSKLQAALQVPYDQQLDSHRPIMNLVPTMQSALQTMKVTVS
ncbi:hypothetical protein [Gordonia jinhuaensis]|nr:hypothetical protein [Gordonia jinhuaensis]